MKRLRRGAILLPIVLVLLANALEINRKRRIPVARCLRPGDAGILRDQIPDRLRIPSIGTMLATWNSCSERFAAVRSSMPQCNQSDRTIRRVWTRRSRAAHSFKIIGSSSAVCLDRQFPLASIASIRDVASLASKLDQSLLINCRHQRIRNLTFARPLSSDAD